MPENLNHQPTPPADQPPDPAAAKVAAREAKRMLTISRWPLFLMVGLLSAAFTVVILLVRRSETAGDLLSGGWALSILLPALAWPVIGRRFRERLGAFAMHRGEKDPREPVSRGMLIGIACGLVGALLLGLVALLLPKEKGPWIGLAVMAPFCLAAGIAMVWGAVVLRFWEVSLLGLLLVATPGLYLLGRSGDWHEPPWPMLLCLSLVMTTVGASMAWRWRRWVRSLPREEADAGAQETNHA